MQPLMVTTPANKITYQEYLSYGEYDTDEVYELVRGKLVEMPPASFLHSDIIDFIADCFKAIAKEYKLNIKVKTGDVGVRTGINSARIPDIAVINDRVWQSYRLNSSAVIENGLMLAVEVVSPGTEQVSRNYSEKAAEYQNIGIPEYWIVDPIQQKITILVLESRSYAKTVFAVDETINSMTFPELIVTVNDILSA